MKIFDIEIKTHNKREETLCYILKGKIERCLAYHDENTFGDDTAEIVRREMENIEGVLTTMFFLKMLGEPVQIEDLEAFKMRLLFR